MKNEVVVFKRGLLKFSNFTRYM